MLLQIICTGVRYCVVVLAQFSTRNPATRLNSFVLLDISVRPRLLACAAIIKSYGPIFWPFNSCFNWPNY